jgi:hypothetical protein
MPTGGFRARQRVRKNHFQGLVETGETLLLGSGIRENLPGIRGCKSLQLLLLLLAVEDGVSTRHDDDIKLPKTLRVD